MTVWMSFYRLLRGEVVDFLGDRIIGPKLKKPTLSIYVKSLFMNIFELIDLHIIWVTGQ